MARTPVQLVRWLSLIPDSETRCLSLSERLPTDATRRTPSFTCNLCDWRDATLSSEFHVDPVARVIRLFSPYRSGDWIHCLHLAVAPLRSGKSCYLRLRESDRGRPAGRRFRRGDFDYAHAGGRRVDYRLGRAGDYGAATQ